jgi:fucose 4-O-acetylase-like acetyltransferase
MSTTVLTPFISSKFRFWSFISMFLLVFVHGYNLEIRYLQPWTIPSEPLSFTRFTEYFLANGIFRFRIPMLFIISGFLFAMRDDRPYKQRTGKRFRTLFLPYLTWSAIGIAFTYFLEFFPYTRGLVAGSHVVQIDDTRMLIHEYHWWETLVRWVFFPISYQLWFIRVLFIYNLAYPALRWCVIHPVARYIFFAVLILLWLGTTNFILFEGEGLLFFSLGIFLQKTDFNIESPKLWLKPGWWGITFVTLAIIKTLLAFIGVRLLGNALSPVMVILHKFTVLSGLIFCWFGLNGFVKFFMNRRWFIWLTSFAFMIYALHTPLVAYAIDAVLWLFKSLPHPHLLAYIFLPLIVITFCVFMGAFIRKFLPGVYGFLTGGRGLV